MAQLRRRRMIFLRHGQTPYNAENRLQGQRDIPLNGKGRAQAGAVGRLLRDQLGADVARLEEIGAFWSSPLERARETMTLARAAMGLPQEYYRLDPRLKELTFGDWEGLTWGEIESEFPGAERAREADKWFFTPPNGESYAALTVRVRDWLEEREDELFVVAHGGVARAMMAILTDIAPGEAANADIWQGRALIFDRGACFWIG